MGGSAAGAFIATALACGTLAALPGAHPELMDLPSMARVTKLPIETLREKAKATPVFAPGLENLAQTGAIAEIWDPARSLSDQLTPLMSKAHAGDFGPRSARSVAVAPRLRRSLIRSRRWQRRGADAMRLDRHQIVVSIRRRDLHWSRHIRL